VRRRALGTGNSDKLTPEASQREALRVLRSNLDSALRDLENPVVLVTSANEGEGKTSTCVPLAKSMAAAGTGVVLLELDLRNPGAHALLGVPNEVGAVDVLSGKATQEEALQYVQTAPNTGLWFMPTGTTVSNPTELLDTNRTVSLLNALANQADIVLVDTAPVLPVADTLVVGRLAAGALIVVEARRTPAPAVQRAKEMLMRNQTRILGLVLNRLRPGDATYTYGYSFADAGAVLNPNGQDES